MPRMKGRLSPAERMEHARKVREAQAQRGFKGAIVYSILAQAIQGRKRPGAFTPQAAMDHLRRLGHTDFTHNNVKTALAAMRREGLIRKINPKERARIRERGAARKGSASSIARRFIEREILPRQKGVIALSPSEVFGKMVQAGFTVGISTVKRAIYRFRKLGLVRELSPEDLSEIERRKWKGASPETKNELSKLLEKARKGTLSYDDRIDLLDVWGRLIVERLKIDAGFFNTPREVRAAEIMKHIEIGSDVEEAKLMKFAAAHILAKPNKIAERTEVIRYLMQNGQTPEYANYLVTSLVDIGILEEFGPNAKKKGRKFVVILPYWWVRKKQAPT